MNYQQQKIDQKILFIFVTNTGLTSRVQHLLYSTAQYTVHSITHQQYPERHLPRLLQLQPGLGDTN